MVNIKKILDDGRKVIGLVLVSIGVVGIITMITSKIFTNISPQTQFYSGLLVVGVTLIILSHFARLLLSIEKKNQLKHKIIVGDKYD